METIRLRHESNRVDDFHRNLSRGHLAHHDTHPMGVSMSRCIYLSCGEEFVWEDRISLRSHDGTWHNYCSYTCLANDVLRRYASNINGSNKDFQTILRRLT